LKDRATPENQETSRSTHRWNVVKIIKVSGSEVTDKQNIKKFTLRFLEANYRARALLDFVPNSITFRDSIYAPDVPT